MNVPKELSSCVNKALYRLSVGDLTSTEMFRYLTDPHRKNTGFEEETARRTVELLISEGFLDDKRYFLLYLKRLDEKCVGPRKIREELTRHGFPRRYVEAALARDVFWTGRAVKLLMKKNNAKALTETVAGKKKLMDHLVRQGYDYAAAREAVEGISDTEESPFSE